MPELPEVETVKKALNKIILNKKIKDVLIYRKNIIEGDVNYFKKTLINSKFTKVDRLGKFLIFNLDNDKAMLSHLRMEGKYIYKDNINKKSEYARIIFIFSDGTILNYDDSRTFGYMSIRDKKDYLKVPPLSELGEEANKNINIVKMFARLSKDKRLIKEVLLDQHIISGLGNIYVDETLFKSKISPFSKANLLTKKDIETILKNAKEILNLAIKHNGSSVHTFTWDNGKSGDMQNFLKVYGKKGESCPNCGHDFKKTFIGGRGTTYCPYCQKLKSDKYVLGITGPISSGKSTLLNELKKKGYKTYSCDEEVDNLYNDLLFKLELKKLFKVDSKEEIISLIKKDKSILNKLNNLIHPIIKKQIVSFIRKNTGKLAIEVPLLYQAGFDSLMDENILILTSKNKDYIVNRGEKGKEQFNLNKDLNYYQYKNKATYIIYNDGSLISFKKEINKLPQ